MLLVQGPLFKDLRRWQGAAMALGDKKGVGMAGRMQRTALRTAPVGSGPEGLTLPLEHSRALHAL